MVFFFSELSRTFPESFQGSWNDVLTICMVHDHCATESEWWQMLSSCVMVHCGID